MTYLLDTNAISETIKNSPNEKLLNFMDSTGIGQCYLSVLTLGEIRKGIERLSDKHRKQKITNWLDQNIIIGFQGRIINIDQAVADKWGYITSYGVIAPIDGLIAASCLVHNLKLVTRNVKDFIKIPGLEIINPWE